MRVEEIGEKFRDNPEKARKFQLYVVMKRLDPRIPEGWEVLVPLDEKIQHPDVLSAVRSVSVEEAIEYDKKIVDAFWERRGGRPSNG